MTRVRKKNKVKIIIGISIVVLLVVILIVVLVRKGKTKEPDDTIEENNIVYELPDTKYSNMTVSNIQMEYLKNNNETMVSMQINNTTARKVVNEHLKVLLLNENGEVLRNTETYIAELGVNEQYVISVILKGDLTSTTQILLQEK